jgi:hypothetical protein
MGRKRLGSLDILEDLEFHDASWRVARITMGVLLALMLATALGAFGSGPLSHARAGNPAEGPRVEYERLLRFGASTRLRIQLGAAQDSTAVVALDRAFLDAFQIRAVTPEPQSTRLGHDGVVYEFAVEPGSNSRVLLELQPARRWAIRSTLHAGQTPLTLTQFVYP